MAAVVYILLLRQKGAREDTGVHLKGDEGSAASGDVIADVDDVDDEDEEDPSEDEHESVMRERAIVARRARSPRRNPGPYLGVIADNSGDSYSEVRIAQPSQYDVVPMAVNDAPPPVYAGFPAIKNQYIQPQAPLTMGVIAEDAKDD